MWEVGEVSEVSPREIIAHARQLRRSMTDAERALWRLIRIKQVGEMRFRRQRPVGQYIVDFVCLEAKLILEIDGGQHADQIAYDNARTQFLESLGYRVLRFWNNDVLQNMDGVVTVILGALGDGGCTPIIEKLK
jgi:very-short-patch-repair endonuclease